MSAIDVKPNLALGLFSDFPYEGQETVISKGMGLYLFTDGVNEAENDAKELFGDERLYAMLQDFAHCESKEIIEETFAQVKRHAAGANQSDDITVMCIKYC